MTHCTACRGKMLQCCTDIGCIFCFCSAVLADLLRRFREVMADAYKKFASRRQVISEHRRISHACNVVTR